MRLRRAIRGARSGSCWPRRWWLGAVLAACLVWAASAQAQPFVYVTSTSNSVWQYDALAGALTPLAPPMIENGGTPGYLAIGPDGKSVYVLNQDDNTLSQYDVGAAGQLTVKTPATVATGITPLFAAVSPDGRSVYVTNRGGTVSQYDVGSGGALTPKTPAMVSTGGSALAPGVAVSPDDRSAYVSSGASTVSQYDIGSGGGLTPKTPATVPAGPPNVAFGASGVAVSPDGKTVYVANALNGVGGEVFQYDVGAGGALTPKSPADVSTGGDAPIAIVVSPDGKSVYVANAFGGGVSEYDVGTGGVLVPKTPATVLAGVSPQGIAMSPDGMSVYVTNFDDATVSQYNVDPLTGVLSPKTPPTVATGSGPHGIAVTPLPRVPTSKEQCQNGGWRNFPQFKNQGDCVSFVETGK
jgi:6-phosphogluconolactonase (cycloisomerase 2 family)